MRRKILAGGRITIPAGMRRDLGWKSGDILAIEEREGGILLSLNCDEEGTADG